jgi:outer membrane lipoprotein-sorting protein
MKSLFYLLICTASVSIPVFSQQDPAAKEILEKFTRKAESDYPVRIEFEYTYESLIDNETFTDTGDLVLNRNQYRLIFRDSEIYCNGESMWNYLVSEDEVYISDPAASTENDDFFLSNPEKLFSFYDDNFKYRLTGELKYLDNDYYQVDLFPFDLNKSFHTITLLIRKDNYRLYSIRTKGKQGVNHTFKITSYQPGSKTTPDTFRFDPSRHPEIEVIDTRL